MWPSIAITDFGKWILKKCLSNKVCLWSCGVFCGYINDKWVELSEELGSNKSISVILKNAAHPMKSVSLHLTCKKDVSLWCILLFYTPIHTLSSLCTQNKKIWGHLWETILTCVSFVGVTDTADRKYQKSEPGLDAGWSSTGCSASCLSLSKWIEEVSITVLTDVTVKI